MLAIYIYSGSRLSHGCLHTGLSASLNLAYIHAVAPPGTNFQNSGPRRIEIGSGSLRGNLFGGRKDYYYDVPDGVKNVSLSWEDKSDNGINFGSENGEVRLNWDKAAKKAHVHAWVNGSIGSNHVVWTVYAWI